MRFAGRYVQRRVKTVIGIRRLTIYVIILFFAVSIIGCMKEQTAPSFTESPEQTPTISPAEVQPLESGDGLFIDGKKLSITIAENDPSLFVPADIVYPELGATFEYSKLAKKATIRYGLQVFEIPEGFNDFSVKDRTIYVESSPFLSGEHMMVPLRAVAESVGGGVKWDGDRKAWQVYSRDRLEGIVDIMGDGTPLKEKLAKYERYFIDERYIFWSALRDGASVYRSDSDGKNIERLLNAATEIVGMDSDRIFFINMTENNNLYSMKKDGTGLKQIVAGSVLNVEINGDTIKYLSLENGLSACSVKTDGSGSQTLNDEITVIDGDWVVSKSTVVTHKNILLKGDLKVNRGCTLTLEDTSLVFDTGRNGGDKTERRIDIKNASIVIKKSVIRSTGQDGGIDFLATESNVDIEDSYISNIYAIQLDQCKKARCTGNYVVNGAGTGFVSSSRTYGAVFENNVIINRGSDQRPDITFFNAGAKDIVIKDNVCVDQGECLFFQQGSSGTVSGNLILGTHSGLCLSLRHDAGNTTYDNNFLQLNYDNGYRISGGDNGDALYSDTLESTSTFSRNVINNARNAMHIQSMRNCVYDSNKVWLQLFDKNENRDGAAGISMQYSHHCEFINNSFESWNGGSGAQLFYCGENRFEGNTFSGFKYGIELWDKSDRNIIKGNKLTDCASSILINGSQGNTIKSNAIISGKAAAINVYNNGDNIWDSNYYSDWQKAEPRKISVTASDNDPLLTEPVISKAETVYKPLVKANFSDNAGNEFITDERHLKDKTFKYIWHKMEISDGGVLTLENVTWLSPTMYNSEPEIRVFNGGKLILKNCRISADPQKMPFYFWIESGGTLIAENCTFENIHEISISGNATFRKCTFIDCYQAVNVGDSKEIVIQNCNVNNSFTGVSGYERINTDGNSQKNIALEFEQPEIKPALP